MAKYKERTVEGRGTLIISQALQQEISMYHYLIGGTEWSGMLFYKITAGDLDTPDDLVINASNMWPMNIGSSAYTEFKNGVETMEGFDHIPDADNHQTGLIHTHHHMNTFFSGTDMAELHDNVENYTGYLSLIVNYKDGGSWEAAMAYLTETEIARQDKGPLAFFKRKKRISGEVEKASIKVMNMIKLDIEMECEGYFLDRYNTLNDRRPTTRSVVYTAPGATDNPDTKTSIASQLEFFESPAVEEAVQNAREGIVQGSSIIEFGLPSLHSFISMMAEEEVDADNSTYPFNMHDDGSFTEDDLKEHKERLLKDLEDHYILFFLKDKLDMTIEGLFEKAALSLVKQTIEELKKSEFKMAFMLKETLEEYLIKETV